MKAAVLESWEHMVMQDIPIPTPGPGQARIKVLYAGVCGSDISVYRGHHMTATTPVVVGHEIMGIIDEINGTDTLGYQAGDRVAVDPLISCGTCCACIQGAKHVCKTLKLRGIHENGGYAQYTLADLSMLVKISDDIPDRIAALAEPFAVGFHVMNRSGMKLGDSALICGAGPIGTILAVCARACGASLVAVSEVNEKRLALAKSLGFETINPAKEDALARCMELTGGDGFDKVYESTGVKSSVLMTTDACKIRGTITPLSLAGTPVEFTLGKVSFKELSVIGSRVYSHADFIGGVRLLERLSRAGDLSPLVSDELSLDDAQKAVDSMITGANVCKILLKCN